jgi:hypothetical protein
MAKSLLKIPQERDVDDQPIAASPAEGVPGERLALA